MSDAELTKDEINQLLKPINTDNCTELGNAILTEDEITKTLTAILADHNTEASTKLIRKLAAVKQPSGSKKTLVLTQDDINQLLTAISVGKEPKP